MAARGSISFDRIADDYDRTRGGECRGGAVADALLPVMSPGPLLEVGVGTGLVAQALTRRGRVVFGVDLSLPMLRYAQGRVPGRVVAGDALRLPVRSGSVDGVVMIHVLHVVGDMTGTLAEAARVLRPGGRLAVSAHVDDEPRSDVSEIVGALDRRLRQDGPRPDEEGHVVRTAAGLGLLPAGRFGYPPTGWELSPADWVSRIEARFASWMWTVDDETWERESAPAVAALRGLPDQDSPREETTEVPLLAFAAPA